MNVYDATQERLSTIMSEFDGVYIAFSGGKDSGLLLNLVCDYARAHYPGRRIGCMHLDYEAQYQMTTDYVAEELARNSDVLDVYHICLPLAAGCATSMFQDHWIPWDEDMRDIWVRGMPYSIGVINSDNCPFPWFEKGMRDYNVQKRFGQWYHRHTGAKRTAALVGIRTQESQNRWNAIHGASRRDDTPYSGIPWSTKMYRDVYNLYPLYDWSVDDVWIANARFDYPYNKLYDLFYMAGVALGNMRVASPFHDQATESLKLYRVIDPNNWGRMIGRTNGVNFTGIYGGTTAMGWRTIQLPAGYTWKGYMEFLLSTLPQDVADSYKKKLDFSVRFWREKGGALSPDTIAQLRELGIAIDVDDEPSNRTVFKENRNVRMEYQDDIDIPDFKLIPTYKRMCVCIMKNDHLCKYMGFGMTKVEWSRRRSAEEQYRSVAA